MNNVIHAQVRADHWVNDAMSPIAPVSTDEPKLSTKTMERIAQIVVLLEEGAKPTLLHDVLVVLCKLAYLDGQLSILKPKETA